MNTQHRSSLALFGNLAVIAALIACAIALARLQTTPWWLASPQRIDIGIALGLVIAYAALTMWCLRPRSGNTTAIDKAETDAICVVHASQTGFAQMLAERSAESLRAAGVRVFVRPLGELSAEDLHGRMLFIASTTGEGDPPDPLLAFVRNVMRGKQDLHLLHYAVLALGDRAYDDFCAFGRQLDEWLRHQGAHPLFDRVEVDNADESALRHWQHHLGHLGGVTDLPDWEAPHYEQWTLVERRQLNPGSVGGAAFHLVLRPPAGSTPEWRAGDIAEIGPGNSPCAVEEFARACGWNPDQIIDLDGGTHTLRELLTHRHLPVSDMPRGQSFEQLIGLFPLLPHREYSIASIAADGRLELLVRLMQRPDGQPGLGSGWLCQHAEVGQTIALRVRSNPNFHPPADAVPLILIGNGTGIAGLRAHLKQRARAGIPTRNWLFFGERNRAVDYFHEQEIEAWRNDGTLERLDSVFSRDQPERRYVQHAVRASAMELQRWVDSGAAIYVCGSLEGMAPAVDEALTAILGEQKLDALRMSGRYRRDVY